MAKSKTTLSREALAKHFHDLAFDTSQLATRLAYEGKHEDAIRALLDAAGYRRSAFIIEEVEL